MVLPINPHGLYVKWSTIFCQNLIILDMRSFKKKKNCPCSKGEYCVNGLKCAEENCFLLETSTLVTIPVTNSIDSRNPLRLISASGYRQIHSFYSFKRQNFGGFHENDSTEKSQTLKKYDKGGKGDIFVTLLFFLIRYNIKNIVFSIRANF